jgi:type II secretory pathway pseudopilin PulG
LKRLKHRGVLIAVIAVVVIAAAAVTIVLLLSGSSEESKARQYLQVAHDLSRQVALNQQKLLDQGKKLTAFFNTIQNITPETATAMKGFFNDLVKDVDAINVAAQATKPEYDKIIALNDVTDFKKYAQNRLSALELINQRSQLIKQDAAIYNVAIDQAASGQPTNDAQIVAEKTPIEDQINAIQKEIEKLNTQAADLAGKLKIEF